ncbi:hypothetical protein F485_gp023 [Aeromonas phage CC2]|uniref:Uncharacterized protein n=1 Tax=Aeromonas phage CC2 TaxID=1204516 RepID=I6WB63_9CAUD|nr:hypothetical protein F485_gp023 [Aeromonas phage CC2]AFN39160.1 hypothetical protein CC2_388 [Aeromonas phage CC2]
MSIEINIKKQAETETNAMLPMLIPSCMGALVASVLVGCGFVPEVNLYVLLCAMFYVLFDIVIMTVNWINRPDYGKEFKHPLSMCMLYSLCDNNVGKYIHIYKNTSNFNLRITIAGLVIYVGVFVFYLGLFGVPVMISSWLFL